MYIDEEDQQQTLTEAAQDSQAVVDNSTLNQLLEPLIRQQRDTADKLAILTSHIHQLEQQIRASLVVSRWPGISERDVLVLFIAVCLQLLFVWLLK